MNYEEDYWSSILCVGSNSNEMEDMLSYPSRRYNNKAVQGNEHYYLNAVLIDLKDMLTSGNEEQTERINKEIINSAITLLLRVQKAL